MSGTIMLSIKPSHTRSLFKNYIVKNIATTSALSKYSSNAVNHYDIVIAGGGMVGTTLACTLGKNTKLGSKRILLLEGGKQFKLKMKESYSNRVSALNPSTHTLLDNIGAWKHIANMRYAPVKKLQVWDGVSDAMITFNSAELSETVMYVVENDVLLAAVGEEVKQLQNVNVINEAKVKDYVLPKNHENTTQVNMENGNSYTCDLLLGCDGANSQVRKAMGVQYVSWNYNQKGIVATLKLPEDTDNVVAWQRFLPTGPIAFLPLKNNRSSLVWSTTNEHAKTLLELSEDQFVDAVNEAMWKSHETNSIIGETTKSFNKMLDFFQLPSSNIRQLPPNISGIEPESRAAFPLGFGHAVNYIAKGVALAGDAAHRVHPLAGQGVNLGFGDIITLNDIVGEAVYSGSNLVVEDISIAVGLGEMKTRYQIILEIVVNLANLTNLVGSLNHMKQYESTRQRHNVPTMLAIDGLHKLYNTTFTPVVVLRSLGLQFTHALTPLKSP